MPISRRGKVMSVKRDTVRQVATEVQRALEHVDQLTSDPVAGIAGRLVGLSVARVLLADASETEVERWLIASGLRSVVGLGRLGVRS